MESNSLTGRLFTSPLGRESLRSMKKTGTAVTEGTGVSGEAEKAAGGDGDDDGVGETRYSIEGTGRTPQPERGGRPGDLTIHFRGFGFCNIEIK
jgi:hypothetical protein